MATESSNSIVFNKNRLNYVGQDASHIPSVLSKLYGKIVLSLDLSFNSLVILDELKNFPYLEELVLDNNHLNDSLSFPFIPTLHTLSLNKNQITNLELLLFKIDKAFPNLKFLSLLGNIACPSELTDSEKDEDDYKRYRLYVLYRLPQLQFLDSRSVNHEERRESSIRGKYMKVARPSSKYNIGEESQLTTSPKYTPLPEGPKVNKKNQGIYSKCKFKYSGKHSEGNRFIRNNDL